MEETIRIFALSGLFNAIIAIIFGLIVVFSNWKNWRFLLITFATAFWSFFYWLWLSSNNSISALFFVRMLSIGSTLILPTYFHWLSSLLGIAEKQKKIIILAYSLSIIFIVAGFSPLFIKSVKQELFFPFWPQPGIIYTIYLVGYIALFIYSIFQLILNYRTTTNEVLRGRIRYILIGSILGLGGGATNFFLWYGVPIPPYGNFLVAFYPIVFAYAILKYQLFDIKIILAQLVVFMLWGVTLVRLFLAKTLQEALIEGGFLAFLVIFGILLIRSVLKEVEQREKLEVLTENLKAANERLEQLNKLKSEFLSFASHQVKSPMAIVKGYASLIEDGTLKDPNEIKATAGKIKQSSDRLIGLVNNFLDLRKIEEGRMEFNFEEKNLVEAVRDIVEELKPLAQKKNLELSFESEKNEIKVNLDGQKFSQVIQNIIDNAIKYTEKGWVRVEIKTQKSKIKDAEEALITISDSGRGISQELLPKLFEQFSRDSSVKKEIQGTGLGLYIAKQIVLAHKGDIWAESEGEGKGSRFIVKLPIKC